MSFAYFTAIYIGGPVLPQLRDYLDAVFLHGDFGRLNQFGARAVSDVLREGIPVDVALLFGGLRARRRRRGCWPARRSPSAPALLRAAVLNGFGALALAAPVYTTAAVIVVYFGSGGGKFRLPFVSDAGVYRPLTEDPLAWLHGLWIPWLAIALPVAGAVMRLTTSATTDALADDPVRTARAKGVDDRARCAATRSRSPIGVSAYAGRA